MSSFGLRLINTLPSCSSIPAIAFSTSTVTGKRLTFIITSRGPCTEIGNGCAGMFKIHILASFTRRTPCVHGGRARRILNKALSGARVGKRSGRIGFIFSVSRIRLPCNACRLMVPENTCYYPRARRSCANCMYSNPHGMRAMCRFTVRPPATAIARVTSGMYGMHSGG